MSGEASGTSPSGAAGSGDVVDGEGASIAGRAGLVLASGSVAVGSSEPLQPSRPTTSTELTGKSEHTPRKQLRKFEVDTL